MESQAFDSKRAGVILDKMIIHEYEPDLRTAPSKK